MTPFPESETMTIKRLEVALRKEDWQLLKDGAYKLHEKFHSGHKFEYIDDLKQVLYTVESNASKIPPDITDILRATIKEIIVKYSDDEVPFLKQEDPSNPPSGHLISHEEELNLLYPREEETINPPRQESLFSENTMQNTFEAAQQMAQASQGEIQTYSSPSLHNDSSSSFGDSIRLKDEVALFYDDTETKIDFSEIKDYRNNLNYLFSKNPQTTDFAILRVIAWINQNVNLPIVGMDEVLSAMANIEGKVSLLTTSQSANIIKALESNNIDYMIPFVKKAKNEENFYDLIPMLGLSNIFVCSSCNNRFLSHADALSLQCPHCSSSAFPDLYAINSYNPDCNPIYWHRAFARLVKARVWVLINPPLDQDKEIVFDLLKTAYSASLPERIYIHSADSDKREFYKRAFININPQCDIKAHYASQTQLCDEFMNIEVAQRILM